MVFIAILIFSVTPAHSAMPPTLLVLPLDMIDTSGETPPRAAEYEGRLVGLASYLSKVLAGERVYALVDPTPIDTAIATARSTQPLSACNGCERDLAGLVHADRVLVGQIDKVSTLIGSLTLRIANVETGQVVFARTVSFRGDTDEAWQRAAQSLARYLKATMMQER
jgi:hypothetical protein